MLLWVGATSAAGQPELVGILGQGPRLLDRWAGGSRRVTHSHSECNPGLAGAGCAPLPQGPALDAAVCRAAGRHQPEALACTVLTSPGPPTLSQTCTSWMCCHHWTPSIALGCPTTPTCFNFCSLPTTLPHPTHPHPHAPSQPTPTHPLLGRVPAGGNLVRQEQQEHHGTGGHQQGGGPHHPPHPGDEGVQEAQLRGRGVTWGEVVRGREEVADVLLQLAASYLFSEEREEKGPSLA